MAERIINKNKWLFGPGPLARRAKGIGAKPPLQGLVITACQGLVVALGCGFTYTTFIGNPGLKQIEDYYKENPTR